MEQQDDKRGRSRWSSSEGERWWTGAIVYSMGAVGTAVTAALIILAFIEELWILLVVVAVIVGLLALVWQAIEGNWP
ncbi:MAG TPA: hypothetical protein VH834_19505 [Solirubrobacteraceae bacterium]|jgi:hypothetical protein